MLMLFNGYVRPASLKQKLAASLPHLVILDVDTVLPDSRMGKYLRECNIDIIYTPSSGLLTTESLMEAALRELRATGAVEILCSAEALCGGGPAACIARAMQRFGGIRAPRVRHILPLLSDISVARAAGGYCLADGR
jgi:hypothetical protein